MSQQHSREEVLSALENVEVATVATAAGDRMRTRMMHFAAAPDFTIYLATMKGDPKTVQITHHPSISILAHQAGADVNDSHEVEISGTAAMVNDPAERARALEMTAKRSPVVKYLRDSGNAEVLDCIKVVPDTVKFRVFREIVQGLPPTVFEFPQNRLVVSDWYLLKTKLKNWSTAMRWSFLTASVVPVLLGTAMGGLAMESMRWGYLVLALLAGVLLHAGTNVINDYFDHKTGNDDANREFVRPFSGGSRVIQLGLLSPLELLLGSLLLFALGIGIGVYLAWARGPILLAFGAVGLLSGALYSWRPFYWSGRGIGELLVGLNFGLLMTLGAYYVQTQSLAWAPLVAAVPVALLISAILYINEFPDYTADKEVGRRTLVVRLGRKRAVHLYTVLMVASYPAIVAAVATGVLPLPTLLSLGTIPLALRAISYARRHYDRSFDLVPANALTITGHLALGLLLTLAYAWEGLGNEGIGYLVLLALAFGGFVGYMYHYVERQKDIFLGLKKVVS